MMVLGQLRHYLVSVREVGWNDEAHAVSFVYWAKERSYRFATPALPRGVQCNCTTCWCSSATAASVRASVQAQPSRRP